MVAVVPYGGNLGRIGTSIILLPFSLGGGMEID
jgi:hypothetical protein